MYMKTDGVGEVGMEEEGGGSFLVVRRDGKIWSGGTVEEAENDIWINREM